jgi:hypothetical protein
MKNIIKLSIVAAIALLIPRSSGRSSSNAKSKKPKPEQSQNNITHAHQNTAIDDPKHK